LANAGERAAGLAMITGALYERQWKTAKWLRLRGYPREWTWGLAELVTSADDAEIVEQAIEIFGLDITLPSYLVYCHGCNRSCSSASLCFFSTWEKLPSGRRTDLLLAFPECYRQHIQRTEWQMSALALDFLVSVFGDNWEAITTEEDIATTIEMFAGSREVLRQKGSALGPFLQILPRPHGFAIYAVLGGKKGRPLMKLAKVLAKWGVELASHHMAVEAGEWRLCLRLGATPVLKQREGGGYAQWPVREFARSDAVDCERGKGYVMFDKDQGAQTVIELGDLFTIREGEFERAVKLVEATLPVQLKVIPGRAFKGCGSLKVLRMGGAVSRIGEEAFANCSNLGDIAFRRFPITRIGDRAFELCGKLKYVSFGTELVELGERAFGGCSSILTVVLPDSLERIGPCAFACCRSLRSSDLGRGLTELPRGVFRECISLKSVWMGQRLAGSGQEGVLEVASRAKIHARE
jgi:hypothetical protein